MTNVAPIEFDNASALEAAEVLSNLSDRAMADGLSLARSAKRLFKARNAKDRRAAFGHLTRAYDEYYARHGEERYGAVEVYALIDKSPQQRGRAAEKRMRAAEKRMRDERAREARKQTRRSW